MPRGSHWLERMGTRHGSAPSVGQQVTPRGALEATVRNQSNQTGRLGMRLVSPQSVLGGCLLPGPVPAHMAPHTAHHPLSVERALGSLVPLFKALPTPQGPQRSVPSPLCDRGHGCSGWKATWCTLRRGSGLCPHSQLSPGGRMSQNIQEGGGEEGQGVSRTQPG